MGGKMKWFWVNSFVLLIGVASLVSSQVDDDPGQIQLNGQWMYMNSNKTISGVGNVPGSIYTDLMRDKKLGDPYYRFNDVAYRWVSYDNWTYSRSFNMPAELLGSQHVELWAGGLDTVASIFINDRPVESTNNMFRRYIFNIKPMTHEGKNDIRIEFQSAVQYAKAQSAAYPYMVPPECPPDVQHGECHFNFIRKEAASFSWDWGPAFPTQGIWRNITIRAYDDAVIDYIVTQTVKGRESDSGDWYLRLRTFFRLSADTSGTFSVFIPSLGVKNTMAANITTSDPSFSLEIELLKSQNVEAWWPNGEGDQKLYEVTVVFQSKMQMSAKKINVGFRTVELVEGHHQHHQLAV